MATHTVCKIGPMKRNDPFRKFSSDSSSSHSEWAKAIIGIVTHAFVITLIVSDLSVTLPQRLKIKATSMYPSRQKIRDPCGQD